MNCPKCSGNMKKIKDSIRQDKVDFEAYKCNSCGEELMNMKQLKQLSNQYRELRKSKEIRFSKWGNSLAIRIPREIVNKLKLQSGNTAIIKENNKKIQIIPS